MKKFVRIVPCGSAIAASLALLLGAGAQADEIYKWVDKDGKTHYSSRKEDAAGAKTTTIRSEPVPTLRTEPPPAARAANEDLIRRGAAPDASAPRQAEQPAAQKPVARSYTAETNAAKCQLARDILAGKAIHRNDAPVDAYDRQVAENDVRAFCGK